MNKANKEDKKTAAIYVRVSTEEQSREGFSINAQIEVLSQYCRLYDIKIYEIYKDLGISGKSLKNRNDLQRLLADAEQNKFNIVLVWKISRLSRNLKDLLNIIDFLEKNKISFISYSEKLDTSSPTGKMTLQLLGSIAEFERNTIIENVKLGMREFARTGGKAAAVFGYDNIDKQLVVNEAEAAVIKLIYNMYLKNISMIKIAKYLNEHGYRTKRGKLFRADSISTILRNPVYIGINRHMLNTKNEYYIKGKHNKIIDDNIYEQVRHKLEKIKVYKKRNPAAKALLSNLISCPECNEVLKVFYTASRGKNYRYYRCYRKNCSFMINADFIEARILSAVKNIISSSSISEDIMKNLNLSDKQKGIFVLDRLEELQNAIKKQNKLIDDYLCLYEKGKIDNSNILLERIDIIEKQLQLLRNEKDTYDISNQEQFTNINYHIDLLSIILDKLDITDKRYLIDNLIDHIVLKDKKSIKEVVYKFPVSEK